MWNIRKHGTEETGIAEEKSEKGAKTEKTVVHTAQKKKKRFVQMLKITKKSRKSVDIGQSAYYDTDMEQVPHNKTTK